MPETRRLVSLVLSIVAILSLGLQPQSVSAQGADGLKRQINAETGKLSFISTENGRALSVSKALGISPATRLADPAMALAKRFGPEFGLNNPKRDLNPIKTDHTLDGQLSIHYQQTHQGVPVMGGELIVNTNDNGDLYSINGEVSTSLSLSTQPKTDPERARQIALQAVAKWYQKTPADFLASEPTLWIYDESLLRQSSRPVELVWRMDVTANDQSRAVRELVLINAQRGGVSLHFNQVDTAWTMPEGVRSLQNAPLNAPDATMQVTANAVSSNVVMKAGLETSESLPVQAVSPIVKTYTAGNSSSLPGTFLCDQNDLSCTSGDSHAKAAHQYAIGTYNLYQTKHNRNGIDNNNMAIISSVHYCVPLYCPYPNAFWNGAQMVYGDAYGFPLADDVVAHELTHGVTQYESNLFYYYQSGAINESFSDLWGEYYDQTNGLGNDSANVKWRIGEDISGLGAIRDMQNPTSFGHPDKMSSIYYDKSGDDNGGVHTNSGINNKAVFLMVDGGTFNGKTVSPLGWDKTAAIYYEVNTHLLSSGADYSDLYYALQQACSNLIGQKGITSADCNEVKNAIDAVEMNGQPAPNFNLDSPLCGGDTTPNISLADDLENGTANWTFTNGASLRWQLDSAYGPYAQSGLHSLYADDYPAAITDAKARWKSFTVPNNAYLYFTHAYDFESFGDPYYFDGGVLEYSMNGGSTWLDAGSLIDFNGYNGTIYRDWNNPLKGRPAFVGSSHGYISTRLKLASLGGQTVTFRWRMGLDDYGYAWGWWVDNIRVYTCIGKTPAGATLITPSGNIGDNSLPTYAWNKVANATWYYLWVNGPSGNVFKQWYESSTVCGSSTCSVTPAKSLNSGTHTWWIQTWNEAGYGPWSAAASFTIPVPAPPGAPTLLSPSGSITDTTPTYTWNKISSATWYYLWVNGPSGNIIKQWYDAAVVCGASTCSATPAMVLGGGAYIWWVQAWNSSGYSPWSDSLSFSLPSPLGTAILIAPTGSIVSHQPTYSWNKVSGATWYYLWVNGPSGNIIKQWYQAAAICSTSTCSVAPSTVLNSGTHTWWVQTWNDVGYGPWSGSMSFSIP